MRHTKHTKNAQAGKFSDALSGQSTSGALTVLCLFLCLLSVNRATGQALTLTQQLAGTWYMVSTPTSTDSVVFSRTSAVPMGWGDRIEFQEHGVFVDAYSSRCGNDNQVHHYTGYWELEGRLLTTSIPISADTGVKHHLVSITTDRLVLARVGEGGQ